MHKTLLVQDQLFTVVKLQGRPVVATTGTGQPHISRLFFVHDRTSDTQFLIDTGAEVSVRPSPVDHSLKPAHFRLRTANQSIISTYGQRSPTLGLELD